MWAGFGEWWTPATWMPAADLVAGHLQFNPAEDPETLERGCASWPEAPQPESQAFLLQRVLMSNLAASFAAKGDFSVFAFLYTPLMGLCDPAAAEFVVVLSQLRTRP